MRAQLIALVGMMLAASASLAELQYALLPSLSVLGAATGCSMRAQLIALGGMTLAASAGLAELRYALLPSLSMLGAAEALFGGAPHGGAAAHAEMAAFSAANKDAAGKPRCFNFWASTSELLPQPFLSFRSRVSGVVEILPDRDSYPKWQPSLQPIGTQQGSLGASTFGIGRLPQSRLSFRSRVSGGLSCAP
jgi:hypothetical protein